MCSEVEFRSQVISRELYIHIYFVYFFKSPRLVYFFFFAFDVLSFFSFVAYFPDCLFVKIIIFML